MRNYGLLHNTNMHKHQHSYMVENPASHIYELMLELGYHIEHLEDRFTIWLRAIDKFLRIVYHDKKLLALFCGIIVLLVAIIQVLVLIIKFSMFQ